MLFCVVYVRVNGGPRPHRPPPPLSAAPPILNPPPPLPPNTHTHTRTPSQASGAWRSWPSPPSAPTSSPTASGRSASAACGPSWRPRPSLGFARPCPCSTSCTTRRTWRSATRRRGGRCVHPMVLMIINYPKTNYSTPTNKTKRNKTKRATTNTNNRSRAAWRWTFTRAPT